MKPYLHLYFLSKYGISGTNENQEAEYSLIKKLQLFIKYNPHFGRMTINFKDNIITGKREQVVNFNDKHINYYKDQIYSVGPTNMSNMSNIPNIPNIANTRHFSSVTYGIGIMSLINSMNTYSNHQIDSNEQIETETEEAYDTDDSYEFDENS